MTAMLANIALSGVPYSVDRLYTYLIPVPLQDKVLPGVRVIVPFGLGNRRREGFVMEVTQAEVTRQLKPIDSVLDEVPLLSAEGLRFARWMKARYFCTFYDAVKTILPAAIWPGAQSKVRDKTVRMVRLAVSAEDALAFVEPKRTRAPVRYEAVKLLCTEGTISSADLSYYTGISLRSLQNLEKAGIVSLTSEEVLRISHYDTVCQAEPIVLNDEQKAVFNGLSSLLEQGRAECALLHGVTASGKTQVYLRLVEHALSLGRSAIVLVPEIALTPQMMARFTAYFGNRVALLHSALHLSERYDQWKRIRRGDVQVVLGTRSAIFAPLSNIGLIIMDEEQEPTYQSDGAPRYHTRDIAQFRCAQEKALFLMGSATPTVETTYYARSGRYKAFSLYKRFNQHSLPQVIISDMRKELRDGNDSMIGETLRRELERNLQNNEQSILFLNRRGNSRMLLCGECGDVPHCPRCSVPMTYHSANGRLMCHYCGSSKPAYEVCPECGGRMKYVGAGTQKVEQELLTLFPQTEILRMDADTVASRGHEAILSHFQNDHVPILLGTQMVAKGLDLENVTLVGVLASDLSLYVENYHAPERTFDLLAQVIGRAGRGNKQGRAVIQTYAPENDVIQAAAAQDYEAFYQSELRMRKLRRYPPFADLFTLTISGADERRVQHSAALLRDALRVAVQREKLRSLQLEVLGPAPAGVYKMNNRFRYHVFIVGCSCAELRSLIAEYLHAFYQHKENRNLDIFAECNAL